MQPVFPHFNLLWQGHARQEQSPSDLKVVEGQAGDPAFLQWDAQVSGRTRPVDHAFWMRQQQSIPLWFRRQGVTVGYAYVRQVAETARERLSYHLCRDVSLDCYHTFLRCTLLYSIWFGFALAPGQGTLQAAENQDH